MPEVLERPRTPYREDLCRSAAFELVRAEGEEEGDGLTIDGYGAVFNSVTHIGGWEGDFDEVIAPGAFKKSLRERMPIMQFDHGHHPLVGSLPLGRWDVAEEDTQGLHVVGRLSDNWLIEPFRDAIRDGGVTGMSFRFSIVRDEWTDVTGKKIKDEELNDLLWYGAGERGPILRTLKEVRVSEVGPVTWPAYEDTSVGVRSAAERFIVDLGRLDLRTPRARSELARAVALADAAASPNMSRHLPGHPPAKPKAPKPGIPQPTDAAPASGARTEPRPTATPAAAGHSTEPPVTAAVVAGEHSSALELRRQRMCASRDRIRAAMNTMNRK